MIIALSYNPQPFLEKLDWEKMYLLEITTQRRLVIAPITKHQQQQQQQQLIRWFGHNAIKKDNDSLNKLYSR